MRAMRGEGIDKRERYRSIVAQHAPLLEMLVELYPPTALPALNATDREIGAHIGQQLLIERLQQLLSESRGAPSGVLPTVIRKR